MVLLSSCLGETYVNLPRLSTVHGHAFNFIVNIFLFKTIIVISNLLF